MSSTKTSVTEAIGVGGGSVEEVVVVVVVVVVVSAAASTGSTASTINGSARASTTGMGIGRIKGRPGGGGSLSPEGFLSYNSTVTVTGEGGITSREPWIVRSYPGRTTLGAINRYVLK